MQVILVTQGDGTAREEEKSETSAKAQAEESNQQFLTEKREMEESRVKWWQPRPLELLQEGGWSGGHETGLRMRPQRVQWGGDGAARLRDEGTQCRPQCHRQLLSVTLVLCGKKGQPLDWESRRKLRQGHV